MQAIRKPIKLKIVFIGDSGVGKTTLLNRYFYQGFAPNRINLDLYQRELRIKNRLVHIQVWDTVGQERYEALQSSFYRDADACVLVYDTTKPASLDNLVRWRDQFLKYVVPGPDDESVDVPIVVLSNNNDFSQTSLMELHRRRTEKIIRNATCLDTDLEGSNLDQIFHQITLVTLERKLEQKRLQHRSKIVLNANDREIYRPNNCSC